MTPLFLDIETSPMTVRTWGVWEQNALDIMEEWRVLGFAYAWGDRPPKAEYPSAPEHWPGNEDHYEYLVLEKLWELLDKADIVVAHNGDKFDMRKINARLIYHGFPPPSPYLTIDTLKVAKKHFAFTKNRLDYLGKFLGLDGKMSHSGLAMWIGCVEGDHKSWKKMKQYNKRDITLLRDVYYALRPWIRNHPHMGGDGCPTCQSADATKRGLQRTKAGLTYQRYQCNTCGTYFRDRKSDSSPETRSS